MNQIRTEVKAFFGQHPFAVATMHRSQKRLAFGQIEKYLAISNECNHCDKSKAIPFEKIRPSYLNGEFIAAVYSIMCLYNIKPI